MKKNFLYSVMALFMVLFASCSQEEIISENNGNGKVTIRVGVPGGATTRAGMPEVEGLKRRCIMQVVNENGEAIEGEGMKQIVEVASETVTFTFDEPTGNYSVVFWADYAENINEDYIYDTTNFPVIGYKETKDKMFTEAGDAFCGTIGKGTASATLTRPFNKIVIKSAPSILGEYTQVAIADFKIPTEYNIMNRTCSTTNSATIGLTQKVINTETGEWAYFYMFPSVDQTSTDLTLTITLSAENSTETKTVEVEAKGMPTDGNMIANVNIKEIPTTPDNPDEPNKITVEVSFDTEFTKLDLKVGSYINAAGEVVTNADDAVAVVFALEVLNNDVVANYPETLKEKTIKGYAVAISNVASSRQKINDAGETLTFTMPESPTNGTQTTQAFLEGIGDAKPFVTTYNDWVNAHALTGKNLSDWYIPTLPQLTAFVGMLFKIGENEATGSTEFRNLPEFALEYGVLFDRTEKTDVMYASSTINVNNNISVVTIKSTGTATAAQAAISGENPSSMSILCRPMLTIFE